MAFQLRELPPANQRPRFLLIRQLGSSKTSGPMRRRRCCAKRKPGPARNASCSRVSRRRGSGGCSAGARRFRPVAHPDLRIPQPRRHCPDPAAMARRHGSTYGIGPERLHEGTMAFIHAYMLVLGRPPAEADLQRFFRVTPPSVHQMVLTLERSGLIRRQPGIARPLNIASTRACARRGRYSLNSQGFRRARNLQGMLKNVRILCIGCVSRSRFRGASQAPALRVTSSAQGRG